MASKTYRVDDFGSGLVTAIDPSLLDSSMSPAMSNCDITDSRVITRRGGFASLTNVSVVGTTPVDALYRFHKADESKYWMAVCGTTVFTAPHTSSILPRTRYELTVSNATGVTGLYSVPVYSGGSAVCGSSTITTSVPTCNALTVKIPSASASVSIDGGAFVAVSASTYTPTLAATPAIHTVAVKPAARNATGMQLSTSAGTGNSIIVYREYALDDSSTVELSFYDYPATWGTTQRVYVRFPINGTVGSVGVNPSVSTTHYVVGASVTSVARTTGWHTVSSRSDGIYLDGTKVITGSRQSGTTIDAMYTSNVGGGVSFDTYRIDGVLVDDFTSVSGWTISYNSGGSVSTSGVYDATKVLIVDYIDYSSDLKWTRSCSVSASADTWAFSTLNNKAYFQTAYNNVRSFDGTVTATITASGTNAGGFLVEHKRRLFSAAPSTDRAKLTYTDLDQPWDWTGGGAMYLAGKDSGGRCTGLEVWDNRIFYFSDSRTYSLTADGADTAWVARTISKTHGCIAPKSVAVAPNVIVFLSADGVRSYGYLPGINSDDGSGFSLISENITPTIAAFTDAQKRDACAAYYKNRYWLVIGSKVFVCDLEKRTKNGQPVWVQYDYTGATFTTLYVTRGDEYMLVAGASNGKLYRLDYGTTDNGANIPLAYTLAPFAPGGYSSVKHFTILDVVADGGGLSQNITITPSSDDINGTTQTISVPVASGRKSARTQINARGRSVTLALASSGAAQPLSISEIALRYTPPRVR